MPPIHLTDVQLNVLSAFLLKLTPENAKALYEAPNSAVLGAQIYLVNGCAGCHRVNGVGGSIGPALNGVAKRHSKEWIEQHFLDPKALVPGSLMPSFRFSLTIAIFSSPICFHFQLANTATARWALFTAFLQKPNN